MHVGVQAKLVLGGQGGEEGFEHKVVGEGQGYGGYGAQAAGQVGQLGGPGGGRGASGQEDWVVGLGGGVEEVEEGFRFGGEVGVVYGDGTGVGEAYEVAQRKSGEEDAGVAFGKGVQEMGFAAAGGAVDGEPAGGPVLGVGEPGGGFRVCGAVDEGGFREDVADGEGEGELSHRGGGGQASVVREGSGAGSVGSGGSR